MLKQHGISTEMFKIRCSEATALTLISTFDGARCNIDGGDRLITEMKFEDGLLEYQVEAGHANIPTAKRVNFDEFFFQLISISRNNKSAGRQRLAAIATVPSN
jgi:hypothetical protein